LADRDVSALIGLLAVLEGGVLSGEASSHLARLLPDALKLAEWAVTVTKSRWDA
jgi:hypothetical protein